MQLSNTVMMRLFHTLLLVVALLLSGCVIDTVPIPEETKRSPAETSTDTGRDREPDTPSPGTTGGIDVADSREAAVDPTVVFHSTSKIYLVGAPGAVSGRGSVRVAVGESWSEEVKSTAGGSFVVRIKGTINDDVLLTFTNLQEASISVTLDLTPGSVDAHSATATLREGDHAALKIRRNEEQSGLLISAAAGTLSQGISIVAANRQSGQSAIAPTRANGSFSLRLEANQNDALVLFAVERASSHGGGAPMELSAP